MAQRNQSKSGDKACKVKLAGTYHLHRRQEKIVRLLKISPGFKFQVAPTEDVSRHSRANISRSPPPCLRRISIIGTVAHGRNFLKAGHSMRITGDVKIAIQV